MKPETNARQMLSAAAICCVIALFIAYVVWSDTPGLRTPPAIAYTAAGIFGAGGLALFLQAYGSERGSTIVVTLLLVGMALVTGWIAMRGRECRGTIGFFNFGAGQRACRAAFGLGSLVTSGIALIAGRSAFK